MATINLAPGDHTVVYTKDGYSDLTTTFNVSTTGIVVCKTVSGGVCNRTMPPGCIVSSRTLTGYMEMVEIYMVTITGLERDKASYVVGETVNIVTEIKNTGNVATRMCQRIVVEEISMEWCTSTLISPGSRALHTFTFVVPLTWTPGDGTIYHTAWPYGKTTTDSGTEVITIQNAFTITFASVPAGATIRVDGNLI